MAKMTESDDTTPRPDPTRLTSEAVKAATEQWRRDLQGVREILELTIKGVSDVADQRFSAISTQFGERDERARQGEVASGKSLDAALAAAKEAVKEQNISSGLAIGKSEESTKERLDSLGVLLATAIKSLEDKIRALESRLDRGEGTQVGAKEAVTSKASSTGANMAVLGAVFVGLSLLIGVAALIITLTHG